MDTTIAHQMLVEALHTHNLQDTVGVGWTAKKRTFGSYVEYGKRCLYTGTFEVTRREIVLSRPLVSTNDADVVRCAILHEVAHALAGHSAGHGPLWAAECAKLGIPAEECFKVGKGGVKAAPGAWQSTCTHCGALRTRYRRPTRNHSCTCGGPSFKVSHLLTWVRM